MTISGGYVFIRETRSNGATLPFRGGVDAAGQISASFCQKGLPCSSLSGTIHDKVFERSQVHGYWCYWNVHMTPAPAPTLRSTVGIRAYPQRYWTAGAMSTAAIPVLLACVLARSGTALSGSPGFPRGKEPSAREAPWCSNPEFIRVEAQIDPQGTIRGQYSGDIPPSLGGGTNCIVKFVWQKE